MDTFVGLQILNVRTYEHVFKIASGMPLGSVGYVFVMERVNYIKPL